MATMSVLLCHQNQPAKPRDGFCPQDTSAQFFSTKMHKVNTDKGGRCQVLSPRGNQP